MIAVPVVLVAVVLVLASLTVGRPALDGWYRVLDPAIRVSRLRLKMRI